MRRRRGRPGLFGTMARTAVVAGTASAVVGHSSNEQAQKQADASQNQAAQQAAFDSQAQLAEMKEAGVLTDEEFSAAKAKLLA